jgi:hypothetical protein
MQGLALHHGSHSIVIIVLDIQKQIRDTPIEFGLAYQRDAIRVFKDKLKYRNK